MWRQANADKGLAGNEPLTITAINENSMTAISELNGKTHKLDLNDLQNAHWDYRYTKTADMAQGTTFNNVISLIKSTAKLTNIRRAYIDISRASDHMMIITDDIKSTLLSGINHESDTPSATDTLNKTQYKTEKHFDKTLSKYDNPDFKNETGHSL